MRYKKKNKFLDLKQIHNFHGKELQIDIFPNNFISEVLLENCVFLKKIKILNEKFSSIRTLPVELSIKNCPKIVSLKQISFLNKILLNIRNYNIGKLTIDKSINNIGPCGNIILKNGITVNHMQYNSIKIIGNSMERRLLNKLIINEDYFNTVFMEKGSYINNLIIDEKFCISGCGTIEQLKYIDKLETNKNILHFYNNKTNFDNIYIKKYIGKIFANIKKCHFIETDYMYKNTEVICDIFLLKNQNDKNIQINITNIKTKILIVDNIELKNEIKLKDIKCDYILYLSSDDDEKELLKFDNVNYNKLYSRKNIKDFMNTDLFLNIDYKKYILKYLEEKTKKDLICPAVLEKNIKIKKLVETIQVTNKLLKEMGL